MVINRTTARAAARRGTCCGRSATRRTAGCTYSAVWGRRVGCSSRRTGATCGAPPLRGCGRRSCCGRSSGCPSPSVAAPAIGRTRTGSVPGLTRSASSCARKGTMRRPWAGCRRGPRPRRSHRRRRAGAGRRVYYYSIKYLHTLLNWYFKLKLNYREHFLINISFLFFLPNFQKIYIFFSQHLKLLLLTLSLLRFHHCSINFFIIYT